MRSRAKCGLWTKPQISNKSAASGTHTVTLHKGTARLVGRQVSHPVPALSRTEPWHPKARGTGSGRRTQTQPGEVQVPAASKQGTPQMPEAPAASAGGQISDQNRNISKAPTGVVHHICTRSHLRGHQQQQRIRVIASHNPRSHLRGHQQQQRLRSLRAGGVPPPIFRETLISSQKTTTTNDIHMAMHASMWSRPLLPPGYYK